MAELLKTVEITPAASALVESLRGMGYSPETALADLIDNSIAADAGVVQLDLDWNEGSPRGALYDNGRGLSYSELSEAMRLGGAGPKAIRDETDLGRFGLGLKTASLSQCRSMTIVTRHAGKTSALNLDVDVIAEKGWIAVVPEPLPDHPFITELLGREQGTVVLWDRMDEQAGLSGLDKDAFFRRLQDIRSHLGMVFHRFIGGDAKRTTILVNGRAIKPWDPFLTTHPATTELREEKIRYKGSTFSIKPFVLPHRDRFKNDSEYDEAGGPGGWGARQGFYVYRGKRLLVAGSWLGLGGVRAWTREQSSRLARIRVDLPTGMDADWRIDVRKSLARPPGKLRPRMTAIAARCRDRAREVFAYRGRVHKAPAKSIDMQPVWLRRQDASGPRYSINRKHPAIANFVARGKPDAYLLDALLSMIEQSVPIERIWLDTSEAEGAVPPVFEGSDLDILAKKLAELSLVLPEEMAVNERANLLLYNLPGSSDELRDRLVNLLESAQ